MSFIRYEEASVKVGYGAADCQLLATNVTASENLPMTPVRALGYNGAIAVMPSGPPEGSFSITYNISGGSRTGTCGGGSTSYCDQAKFYCAAESDSALTRSRTLYESPYWLCCRDGNEPYQRLLNHGEGRLITFASVTQYHVHLFCELMPI